MEAVCFSETLVPTNQSSQCHNPDNSNIQEHILKFYFYMSNFVKRSMCVQDQSQIQETEKYGQVQKLDIFFIP
jgi:hypothetical protein